MSFCDCGGSCRRPGDHGNTAYAICQNECQIHSKFGTSFINANVHWSHLQPSDQQLKIAWTADRNAFCLVFPLYFVDTLPAILGKMLVELFINIVSLVIMIASLI